MTTASVVLLRLLLSFSPPAADAKREQRELFPSKGQQLGNLQAWGHIQPGSLLFCTCEHSVWLWPWAHGHHPHWESWGAAVLAAKLSSCTLPVLREAKEVVQSAISLFTSENTLTASIPEAAAAFMPGSLNGCCHTDVAARAQGRDGAFAGHSSPGRGAAGTLGSGALGSGASCTAAPESSSWDRQLWVLKDRCSCRLIW